MLTKTVDVHEAQTNFTKLLALLNFVQTKEHSAPQRRANLTGSVPLSTRKSIVLEGTEVILTQDSTFIARLVPIVSPTGPREAGLHRGAIWTSYEEKLDATDTLPFLLTIAGLGSSGQGDVAEHDEEILAAEIDPLVKGQNPPRNQ